MKKKQRDPNKIPTIGDVEEIVGEIVGQLLSDTLQIISDLFNQQAKAIANKADKADIARIENKLDPTINAVDDHSIRIKRLEKGTAIA